MRLPLLSPLPGFLFRRTSVGKTAVHAAFRTASAAKDLLLRALCAIQGTSLHPLGHTGGIKSAADDVVTNAGQVPHTAAADKHNAVLLQIVADTGDVAGTFNGVRQADSRDFPQSGIGLLGRLCLDAQAHTALLGASLKNRSGGLFGRPFTALTDKLINCGH